MGVHNTLLLVHILCMAGVFGGLIASLCYMLFGVLLCLTLIGIPFGIQMFKIGLATLCPFGKVQSDVSAARNALPHSHSDLLLFSLYDVPGLVFDFSVDGLGVVVFVLTNILAPPSLDLHRVGVTIHTKSHSEA